MIRFVSEGGSSVGCKIIDTETGDDLSKVIAIQNGVTIRLDSLVTAQCKLMMVETDVTAAVANFLTLHPITKDYEPVAAITFRDGWQVEFPEGGAPRVRQETPTGEK